MPSQDMPRSRPTVPAQSGGAPSVPPAPGAVVISEIMYHPVGEAAEEAHEFIEIHNRGMQQRTFGRWKLRIDGKERFVFTDDRALDAGSYLVIAKNRTRLMEVKAYALDPTVVVGDYQGELDNGGALIELLDERGTVVDAVRYDDDAPWPIGADALGAGEAWLPAAQPFAAHLHKGRSIERYGSGSGSQARTWEASPLDGATPGRPNHAAGDPPPMVEKFSASAAGIGGPIPAGATVTIAAALSLDAAEPAVEFFVDQLDRTDEPTQLTPLVKIDGGHAAHLPPQPENTLVRYRFLARKRGPGREVISPRSGDPGSWHAYFVNPQLPSSRTYQMLISGANWTALWTNGNSGPNQGCRLVPSWDARVPAVFVFDGRVYDVRVRYQGGRYHRRAGEVIAQWRSAGPTQPSPLLALSWNIAFPRYSLFEKRHARVILNKQRQSCPGPVAAMESDLFWAANIPAQRFKFARLHINGSYYHYMMEVQNVSEELMATVERPGNPVGDLFKSEGVGADDGLWGKGDLGVLAPACGLPVLRRYEVTYPRNSLDWKGLDGTGHAELEALVEELAAARASGPAAIRSLLHKSFDVEQLLTHYAIRNFAAVWDDGVHNFFLYKRPADGKWLLFPQDFDLDFGLDPTAVKQPGGTFYLGEEGRPPYPWGGVNLLKSAVLTSHRGELARRYQELSATILGRDALMSTVDRAVAAFDMEAWRTSPARPACDVQRQMERVRTWVRDRHAQLQAQLATGLK